MPSPPPNPEPGPNSNPSPQLPLNQDADLDADPDVDMNIDTTAVPPPDAQNADGEEPLPDAAAVPEEPKEPTKKDISLREFLGKMDDYAPIIPDAVTSHHLLLAGLPPSTTPLPLSRLLALATQKFVADIAADAYQYSRMRTSATGAGQPTSTAPGAAGGAGGGAGLDIGGGAKGKDVDKGKGGAHVLGVQRAGFGGGGGGGGGSGGQRAVLTMEDLGCAVGEYGVNVRRGEFYR